MQARYAVELIFLAALWGASFLFMRIAAPEFGAIALIEVRVVVASLFLLPIWYFRDAKHSAKVVAQRWQALTMIGIINSAIPFVLFAFATLHVTGGFASILNATTPIWGALVAWIWLGQRPNINSALGLTLGILGVVILVQQSLSQGLSEASLGALAAACAAIFYGIAANYTSEKLSGVSPLSIATFSQVAAAIVLLPLAIAYYPSGEISLLSWACVVALGVPCTGLAYVLYFRLIASIGSTKAMTVTFLIPIFGSFWGAVFINEVITLNMVIGTLIILSGTALVTGLIQVKRVTQ